MTKLAPIKLEDGTVIYIEATEDVKAVPLEVEKPVEENEEKEIDEKGLSPAELQKRMTQNFQVIESTIRAYTTSTLHAFKQVADANIDKVTLEFGITLGGEAGIPYVSKGTVGSNMKITVECSFPKENKNQ